MNNNIKSICLRREEVQALQRDGWTTVARKVMASRRHLPMHRGPADPASGMLVYHDGGAWDADVLKRNLSGDMPIGVSPFGKGGERRLVKETFGIDTDGSRQWVVYFDMSRGPDCSDKISHDEAVKRGTLVNGFDWRQSTNMPIWASRYTVEVESVAVEQRDGVWHWVAVLKADAGSGRVSVEEEEGGEN